jgi:hypothetical protein
VSAIGNELCDPNSGTPAQEDNGDEKVVIEVTQEMIDAVAAHARKVSEQIAAEYLRRQQEETKRRNAGIRAQVRVILPDITEEQFRQLEDTFSEYFSDMWE